MRVIGRSVSVSEAPAAVRGYLGQSFITAGKEYEVHALAVFNGLVIMQVVDDVGMPSWRPGWLFDVVSRGLPSDWICSLMHDGLSVVMGPDFVARDESSYTDMVELDASQVDRFWKRIDERKKLEA